MKTEQQHERGGADVAAAAVHALRRPSRAVEEPGGVD